MTEVRPFEDEFDENQDIARSRFADMLYDKERNEKYYLGLEAAINRMHERGLKANVLDIGTGTGLLSMMAVKLGADNVVACDGFLPAVECASKIIEANGMKDRIKLIKKHSTQVIVGVDMEQRANILVTEVFDTELIGEGAIETFNHAHKHLLDDDCIVVPSLGTIYVQIVESPLVNSWNKIKAIADLDGDILLKPPKMMQDCPGESTLHDLQLSQLHRNSFRPLTDPIPVFSFDFSSKNPLEKQRKSVKSCKCIDTGLAQGAFMWWDLKMDVDHKVTLSCAPYWAHPDTNLLNLPDYLDTIPWRDHWIQAVYYLPQSNIFLSENREIQIISNHDEFSLWFEIGQTEALVLDKKPLCNCNIHLTCSRSRIMQINDNLRNKKIISHFEEWNLTNSTLLVFGNGCSLIGMASSKLESNPSKVFVLEQNRFLRHAMEEFIDFNKLWNVNVRENCDKIKLSSITHLFYEPSCVDAWPWDDFKYFTFVHKNKNKFNTEIKFSPWKAMIMACPVKFSHLHKIRAPLRTCEGFDMSKYDEMILNAINFADPEVETHYLWEYPCESVGEVVTLLEICVENLMNEFETKGNFSFDSSEKCNGIGLWIDWQLNSNTKSIISTGPKNPIESGKFIEWSMHDRQGVYFVPENSTEVSYHVKYALETNHIEFVFK